MKGKKLILWISWLCVRTCYLIRKLNKKRLFGLIITAHLNMIGSQSSTKLCQGPTVPLNSIKLLQISQTQKSAPINTPDFLSRSMCGRQWKWQRLPISPCQGNWSKKKILNLSLSLVLHQNWIGSSNLYTYHIPSPGFKKKSVFCVIILAGKQTTKETLRQS